MDGGPRLNTPIKPALRLGAKRIVVIVVNTSRRPRPSTSGSGRCPDVFDGAAQVIQALLADPLAQDVQTLARTSELAAERPADVVHTS